MRAAIFSVTIKALDVFVALEFRHRNYVDYVAHTHGWADAWDGGRGFTLSDGSFRQMLLRIVTD